MELPSISLPVALGAIAAIGYMVGRSSRGRVVHDADDARRELRRARLIAKELEQVADSVRKHLANHHLSVAHFKDRITEQLAQPGRDASWQILRGESEQILKPTQRLAEQIAQAYDEIRRQSNQLMAFSQVPDEFALHGANRRGLDETIESMLSLMDRYGEPFSLAIFDIDQLKQVNDKHGHAHGDRTLEAVVHLIESSLRENDIVTRYGAEEFVIVLPYTRLEGACHFAEGIRRGVQQTAGVTISGGVAMALDGDSVQSLLSRADAALYGSKAAGQNQVFRHTGAELEPVRLPLAGANAAVSCR